MRWPPGDLARMSSAALAEVEVRADKELGREVTRLRMTDTAFKVALDLTLAVEDERERRKK